MCFDSLSAHVGMIKFQARLIIPWTEFLALEGETPALSHNFRVGWELLHIPQFSGSSIFNSFVEERIKRKVIEESTRGPETPTLLKRSEAFQKCPLFQVLQDPSFGTELDHGVTAIGYGVADDGTKYWPVRTLRAQLGVKMGTLGCRGI
ncbi:vignain-like protein [Corchorus olitorius]|uniref:Vignain-like protein n=1 Tax=Corchorus olitorius TaxID=93759 RepID=A0A1R3GSX2_9ROSI|nr:vignain-like protein [Corchorus olitorius]